MEKQEIRMDSMVVTVEKKRDFALERDQHEITFKLTFSDELASDIITHTPFVETVTQMFQNLVDDLFEVARTVRDIENTVAAVTAPRPTRESITAALGPMKRCQKRVFHEPCTICASEFTPTQFYRELSCGHIFHKKCIDKWLFDCEPFCPNCRQPVMQNSTENIGNTEED
jgi:hypothetical protein